MVMVAGELRIYCDGGLGNRLNALLSGLALARYFGLEHTIHWPVNANCGAAFADLFGMDAAVSTDSLSSLRGHVDGHTMLLHDGVAAERLNVAFASAYHYASLADFESRALGRGAPVFFYPALLPEWIPARLIEAEVAQLCFSSVVEDAARCFLRDRLGRPFHGLHLRRTDLNIGLSDADVLRLAGNYPEALFFVCSDDPVAERLASANPNVKARAKSSYVAKSDDGTGWLTPKLDEDGRLMGNLDRDRDSVIDAAIDLLILGHSSIVGFSGSTFQTVARLLGEHYGLLEWERPQPLTYFSPNEIYRRIRAQTLPVKSFIKIAQTWGAELSETSAPCVLQSALDLYEGIDRLELLFALAQVAHREKQLQMASIYLRELSRLAPELADPQVLLKKVQHEMLIEKSCSPKLMPREA